MKILFHYPRPFDPLSTSASGIRPQRMMEAFSSLGLEVDAVTGWPRERRAIMRRVVRDIKRGARYAFMYSESTTRPTYMPEVRRGIILPGMDFSFFRWLRRHEVPIGLFYRDIHWRFPIYGKDMLPLKRAFSEVLYRYDVRQYVKYVTCLYLPSEEMARHIPSLGGLRYRALPPGHGGVIVPEAVPQEKGSLRLLYVGGVGVKYQMHELVHAVGLLPQVQLTLCVRPNEWEGVRREYGESLPDNVRVVHEHGTGLQRLYEEADIALLFVAPHTVWQFAAPVKLYEYMGFGKPMLAVRDTLPGAFVEAEQVGWAVPYDRHALVAQLRRLAMDPDEVRAKARRVQQIASAHTWQARARTVVHDLSGREI